MAERKTICLRLAGDKAIVLHQGDITRETTDAIVNAANSELLPGGGVCGAIHRAGGPEIAEECRRIRVERGPVPPGGAVATTGGKLPAKYVIHAVGPVWQDGRNREPETLASCYCESIRAADGLGLQFISFPAISTGIFGYPLQQAAEVAVKAIAEALNKTTTLIEARMVVFDETAFAAFEAALRSLAHEAGSRLEIVASKS
jgi:O-acetyl-ADP-ribose deacetylase (regulator of RNase III)